MSVYVDAGNFLVQLIQGWNPGLSVSRSYLTVKDTETQRKPSDAAELLVVPDSNAFNVASRNRMTQTMLFTLVLRKELSNSATNTEIDSLVEIMENLSWRMTQTVHTGTEFSDGSRKFFFVTAQHSGEYPVYDIEALAENRFESAIQVAVQTQIPWDSSSDPS